MFIVIEMLCAKHAHGWPEHRKHPRNSAYSAAECTHDIHAMAFCFQICIYCRDAPNFESDCRKQLRWNRIDINIRTPTHPYSVAMAPCVVLALMQQWYNKWYSIDRLNGGFAWRKMKHGGGAIVIWHILWHLLCFL
jgi:hypothetical protein